LYYSGKFKEFCSSSCSNSFLKKSGAIVDVVKKRRQTNLERYGNETPSKLEQFKEKSRLTSLERYGVENPSNNSDIRAKANKTNLERYGVENPATLEIFKEKAKQTNLERYGVENPIIIDTFKQKMQETNLERYGVENPAVLDVFKEKAKQTNLERYGVCYPIQLQEIQDKVKKTNMKNYGVEYPLQSEEFVNNVKEKYFKKHGIYSSNQRHYNDDYKNVFDDELIFKNLLYQHGTYKLAEMVGCDISTIHITSKKFDIPLPPRPRSNLEDTFEDFLNVNKIKFHSGSRRILSSGKELDFYLPEHNLAVELNGLYWHSEISGKKTYHYNKWKECDDVGITLLSIQEDEFKGKTSFWFNKILYMTGNLPLTKVHARKCEIRELDNSADFLNEHHLQGSCASSYKFGLFYDQVLVSVMTFSNTRNNQHGVIELSRFCNHSGYLVSGGASKLLSYFVKNYGHLYESIISFSDNNYSNGKVYKTLGFKLIDHAKPDYKYIPPNYLSRHHKANFRKSSIFKKFDIPNDMKNKSEWELMQYLGCDRIWDTGKKKWELKI
jgi:hypothetical protein